MMHTDYYREKISLLNRLLSVGEELLSNLKDWESYNFHLARRDTLIEQLKKLEKSRENGIALQCSDFQKKEIKRTIDLILALDKDIVKSIKETRGMTLESIKVATTKTKISEYAETMQHSGILLDYKK